MSSVDDGEEWRSDLKNKFRDPLVSATATLVTNEQAVELVDQLIAETVAHNDKELAEAVLKANLDLATGKENADRYISSLAGISGGIRGFDSMAGPKRESSTREALQSLMVRTESPEFKELSVDKLCTLKITLAMLFLSSIGPDRLENVENALAALMVVLGYLQRYPHLVSVDADGYACHKLAGFAFLMRVKGRFSDNIWFAHHHFVEALKCNSAGPGADHLVAWVSDLQKNIPADIPEDPFQDFCKTLQIEPVVDRRSGSRSAGVITFLSIAAASSAAMIAAGVAIVPAVAFGTVGTGAAFFNSFRYSYAPTPGK